MGGIKTIVISGQSSNLRAKLISSYCNITQGIWELSFGEIIVENTVKNVIGLIYCNIIIGDYWNGSAIVRKEACMGFLRFMKSPEPTISALNFQKWFEVTNPTDEIHVMILGEDDEQLPIKVTVQVLLRRKS